MATKTPDLTILEYVSAKCSLTCDGCRASTFSTVIKVYQLAVDEGQLFVELRRRAGYQGWIFKGSIDLCPNCKGGSK